MKLFRRQGQTKLSSKQEEIAFGLANRITVAQQKTATWLNGKTEHLSTGTWVVLLFLICAIGGTYCFYLLLTAFN